MALTLKFLCSRFVRSVDAPNLYVSGTDGLIMHFEGQHIGNSSMLALGDRPRKGLQQHSGLYRLAPPELARCKHGLLTCFSLASLGLQ